MRPRSRPSRPARALTLLGAALALYLLALAAIGLAARPRPSELAVVFGNTVQPDGTPAPRLRARLDTALALYRSGMARHILVSGGVEPGGQDEAAVMAAYLRDNGVPGTAVTQDADGGDSFETARHASALRPAGGVIVVTQWFHVPRAELAMRRFGLDDVSGAWPHWAELRDAYSFLREAAALPYYALRSPSPGALAE